MIVGYLRVSSIDQNLERQLDGVELDRVYEEKISGTSRTGKEFESCVKYLSAKDELYVQSMHIIATNSKDLYSVIICILAKSASIFFIDENLSVDRDTDISLLFMIKEFESKALRERQLIGVNKAKNKGVNLGRDPVSKETQKEVKEMRLRGDKVKDISKKTKLAASTVYKYIKP